MYLRCFNVVPAEDNLKKVAKYQLLQTEKSGALLIPEYFYDYKKFHNYQEEKPKQIVSLLNSFDFLKNFNLKKVNIQKGKSTPIKGKTLVSVYKNIYNKDLSTAKDLS